MNYRKGFSWFFVIVVIFSITTFYFENKNTLYNLLIDQLLIIENFVLINFYFSLIIFFLLYFLIIISNLPIAFIMSVVSGYFYGNFYGSLLIVFSATISYLILILIYKKYLMEYLKRKMSKVEILKKISNEVYDNALASLLFIRFSGLPFAIQNFLIANFEFKILSIFLVTLISVAPMAIIFSSIGAGMSEINNYLIFDASAQFPSMTLFTIIPIVIMSIYFLKLMKKYISKSKNLEK